MAMENGGEGKVEKRWSGRQLIPEVLVDLRRDTASETPDWVGSAVDISLKGMLLRLPLEAGRGELLYVDFTLGPHTFRRLKAIVLRRELGDLGVLGFTAWPLQEQLELAAWLKDRAAEEEPQP